MSVAVGFFKLFGLSEGKAAREQVLPDHIAALDYVTETVDVKWATVT
ncbi:MAG: hypothetical protein ABIT58_07855 [Ferruginibacter sp.]